VQDASARPANAGYTVNFTTTQGVLSSLQQVASASGIVSTTLNNPSLRVFSTTIVADILPKEPNVVITQSTRVEFVAVPYRASTSLSSVSPLPALNVAYGINTTCDQQREMCEDYFLIAKANQPRTLGIYVRNIPDGADADYDLEVLGGDLASIASSANRASSDEAVVVFLPANMLLYVRVANVQKTNDPVQDYTLTVVEQ